MRVTNQVEVRNDSHAHSGEAEDIGEQLKNMQGEWIQNKSTWACCKNSFSGTWSRGIGQKRYNCS